MISRVPHFIISRFGGWRGRRGEAGAPSLHCSAPCPESAGAAFGDKPVPRERLRHCRAILPTAEIWSRGMPSWRGKKKKKEAEICVLSLFPIPPPVKYLAEGTNQKAGCKRGVNTSTEAPGRQRSRVGGGVPHAPHSSRGEGRDPQTCPGGGERARGRSASCRSQQLISPGHAITKITRSSPSHRYPVHPVKASRPQSGCMVVLGQAGRSLGKPGLGGVCGLWGTGHTVPGVPHRTRLARSEKNARRASSLYISLYNDTYIHGFELHKYLNYIKLLSAFIYVMYGGSYI